MYTSCIFPQKSPNLHPEILQYNHLSSGLTFGRHCFHVMRLNRGQMHPAVAFLINSGFHVPLSLSSHVVPREIRLSFELVCHRHIDEVVIIAAYWNFLGKKAWPSDTLPVLWRAQQRDGFPGLLSKLQLWWLRERRLLGFQPEFNLMAFHLQVCNQCTNQTNIYRYYRLL